MKALGLSFHSILLLAPLAMAASGFGQDLFEEIDPATLRGPLSAEQKAAGERESIFCNTMKTAQVCSHGTAAILGLDEKDTVIWTGWARKYNKAMNDGTEQLFKDASTILTPEQMTLLKSWFAIGWNPQINSLLYGKELDSVEKAKIGDVKQMSAQKESKTD